ncbi:MAG: hypothetical protein RR620_08975 [Clostridium sp.]
MGYQIVYYIGIAVIIIALILSVVTFIKFNVVEAFKDIFGTDINTTFKKKNISSKNKKAPKNIPVEVKEKAEIEEKKIEVKPAVVEEVIEDDSLLEEDTGLLEDETGLLEDETGLLEDETGLLEEETGLLEDETGLLEDETGLLMNDHGFTDKFTIELEAISINTEDKI